MTKKAVLIILDGYGLAAPTAQAAGAAMHGAEALAQRH